MDLRMTCRGGVRLGAVIASVVERLAREAGLKACDAEDLAASARVACSEARAHSAACCLEGSADGRDRLEVELGPGADASEIRMTARLTSREPAP